MKFYTLRAPIAGRLGVLQVAPGQTVPVGTTIADVIDLDEITWGFQPGQLIIVASRPSMGKTALALNICDHSGVNSKVPVLFVSLEMGHIEIGERLPCQVARRLARRYNLAGNDCVDQIVD